VEAQLAGCDTSNSVSAKLNSHCSACGTPCPISESYGGCNEHGAAARRMQSVQEQGGARARAEGHDATRNSRNGGVGVELEGQQI
jgi:hypothetical protein